MDATSQMVMALVFFLMEALAWKKRFAFGECVGRSLTAATINRGCYMRAYNGHDEIQKGSGIQGPRKTQGRHEGRHESRHDTSYDEQVRQLIDFCDVPRSRSEIQEFLGTTSRGYFAYKYIKPLVEKGKLEMTIPDKPQSRNQKYIRSNS